MMKRRRNDGGGGEMPEVEDALVTRLRRLEWPKPTSEVKQRCLDEILDRMSEMKKEGHHEASGLRMQHPPRGLGETHSLTRRIGDLSHREPPATRRIGALSHRQAPAAPKLPVRVATVLW
jgi:hypothetical protein